MDSTKIRSNLTALLIGSLVVLHGSWLQDRRLIVKDEILPTLSQTRYLNIVSPDGYFVGQRLKWTRTITHDGPAAFVRLHVFVDRIPKDSEWFLRVSDSSDVEIDRLTPDVFRDESRPGEVWTRRIPGHSAVIQLLGDDRAGNLRIKIDRYNYEFSEPAVKALIGGRDDREDLVLAYGRNHRFYRWGLPIAELLFVSVETQKDTNCTGFLVTSNLLLTNHHCVSQPWQLRTAKAVFGYESEPRETEQFSVTDIVAQSEPLDFSLLRLDKLAEGWQVVIVALQPIHSDAPLVLIQQPNGGVKKIAVRKCKVQFSDAVGVSGSRTDFYHLCDSEGGSSGSPVMDAASGEVVGLHHAGQYDPTKMDYHNLGVKIGLVMREIRKQKPEVCNEIVSCKALS